MVKVEKSKRRTADGDAGGYTDAFAAPKEYMRHILLSSGEM